MWSSCKSPQKIQNFAYFEVSYKDAANTELANGDAIAFKNVGPVTLLMKRRKQLPLKNILRKLQDSKLSVK